MTVHVAGAGMAGLAAALASARAGHRVMVHEAAAGAGGRCRSFFDAGMNRTLDNGTHVVLGGNRKVREFLSFVGGDRALEPVTAGPLPFLDLSSGERWHVDAHRGAVRAVLQCGGPRVLAAVLRRLLGPGNAETVAEAYGRMGRAYGRLVEPFAKAVLNRSAKEAPAADLAPVLRCLALCGKGALAPYLAPRGLSPDWIDPALTKLAALGAEVRYHDPLTAIEVEGDRLRAANFRTGAVSIGRGDALILALPPWALGCVSPPLALPRYETGAIVCAHFVPSLPPRLPDGATLMGMTGATAEWLALRGDVLSVTVSAAEGLLRRDAPSIATLLWREAAAALGAKEAPLPPHRVIKERRATARTVGGLKPGTRVSGLLIAGGWCHHAMPDTLEAAVRSGVAAANSVGSWT